MATRTISLREEAYERLRQARKSPGESFSDVVMRAVWPDAPLAATTYLRLLKERGALYTPEELDRVKEASRSDLPPDDKWREA